MPTTIPTVWTLSQFRHRTTAPLARRGLLSAVDTALGDWNNGNCHGNRKRYLLRIIRACRGWLRAKHGKTTSLCNRRRTAVETLAAQAFHRLQYESFRQHKQRGHHFTGRGLQGGYAHERTTYLQSHKQSALSGSTASAFISGSAAYGIQNPPNFNTMSLMEFEQLVRNHAPEWMEPMEVEFFTRNERTKRLVVPTGGRLYKGPNQRFDTGGGQFAYAMDLNGNLFSTDHHVEGDRQQRYDTPTRDFYSRFNHSTFNAGKDVVCAGILEAQDGYLTYVDNASGHYKPTRQHIHELLVALEHDGLDFTHHPCEVRIMEMYQGAMQWSIFNNATTLIANVHAQPDQRA